jgi:hypothetical protein
VLRECVPNDKDDPNWVASAGNMAPSEATRFMEKATELRNAHPKLDWSGVSGNARELRRIANYYSDITE